jgi:hypothetical protein
METESLLLVWGWDKSEVSIGISCGAFLISVISIILSILSYRKDRWRLSLEAWIKGYELNPGMPPNATRGELFVKMANIGRRALTIEKICLQVFEDEIEELNTLSKPQSRTVLVRIEMVEHIGSVARFPLTRPQGGFPVQLTENEPMTAEMILLGLDPLSRRRFCLVNVTGRRKPIKIPFGGKDHRPKIRDFSGS